MSFIEWLSLAAVCLIGAATPGPSLAVIVHHTVRSGLVAGQLASLFHAIAILVYAFATVFGLAALFDTTPFLFELVATCGSGYLLYLATKLFIEFRKLDSNTKPEISEVSTDNITVDNQVIDNRSLKGNINAIKDGFMIAFLNPKLVLFFVALFSQFIPKGNPEISVTSLLIATVFLIDLIWYLVICKIINLHQAKYSISSKNTRWFYLIQSIVFLLIAINTLYRIY
jgi:threonine/homoserine/homoserine lactone efflux protein